ncbi:MAG: cyclic nucleotide-binding domain-containing protein [Syntrophaceae bacterium]
MNVHDGIEASEYRDRTAKQFATQRKKTIQAFQEQVTVFKYLSPVECRVMYTLTAKKRYNDGDVILPEGAPGTGLHIIETGEVVVSKRRSDGTDVVIDTIGQYGHFGEMSILNNQPVNCTITASGPVDVLVMPPTQFFNLLHRSEALGIRILRALCEELSNRLRQKELTETP